MGPGDDPHRGGGLEGGGRGRARLRFKTPRGVQPAHPPRLFGDRGLPPLEMLWALLVQKYHAQSSLCPPSLFCLCLYVLFLIQCIMPFIFLYFYVLTYVCLITRVLIPAVLIPNQLETRTGEQIF